MNSAKNKYIITTKYEIFLREKLRYSAQTRLSKKYDPPSCFYNVKIINDLIFNEETHLVVLFREYCTLENTNEYFRRFYFKEEIIHRMPKILFFYDKYSKIYPNYTSISESKYMYKNIKRKQKMIDNIQVAEKKKSTFSYSDIFNPQVKDSINSQTFTLNCIPTCTPNNSQSCSINYSVANLVSTIDKIDRRLNDQNKNGLSNNINAHINIMQQSGSKQQIMSSLGKYKSLGNTHFFSKHHNYNKKTISVSSSTNTTTITKKTSVLIQAHSKSKINSNKINLQNPIRRNKNSNDFKTIMHSRLISGNKTSGSKGKNSYTNTLNVAKSSNVSHSKTERIVSSPGNRNLNDALNYNGVKKRNNINIVDNKKPKTKKKRRNSKENIQPYRNNKRHNSNTKIKSSDFSHRNIYSFLNNANLSRTKIINQKPKSKSPTSHAVLTIKTRKTSPNNNNINNNISTLPAEKKQSSKTLNVINNLQQTSNQINKNNHNTCNSDLLKHIYSSILHSSIMKQKISQQQKQKYNQNNSSKCSPNLKKRVTSSNEPTVFSAKSKQKFELNIKKLIKKNLLQNTIESRTERYMTNSSKNSLFGSYSSIYYNTNNNCSSKKVRAEKVKINKNMNDECKKQCANNMNKVNELFKPKLKTLYDINQIIINSENRYLNNSGGFTGVVNPRTDRNSKTRITFK